MRLGTGVMVLLVGLAGTAQATDLVTKCQEAKLKARGKLELCLNKNSAKVLGGKPDASAACQTKFSGALTKAGTCRYLDNGDQTVSDLDTGLQWEKKDNADGIVNSSNPHDVDNSLYTWSDSPPAANGTAFTDFLDKLNRATAPGGNPPITGCFAGHCDWRLPTTVELHGIFDATQGQCNGGSGGCIDPVFGPTQADSYLSAISSPTLSTGVYAVFFNTGGGVSNGVSKTDPDYVRAVRGGL
jgi:hypothetical protein